MLRIAIIVTACILISSCCQNPDNQVDNNEIKVEAKVYETTELMSVVMRLSGAKEYNLCNINEYAAQVDSCFGAFKNHKAVKLAQKLHDKGFSYDMPMNTSLRLVVKNGHIKYNLCVRYVDYHGRLNTWQERKIVRALDRFYRDTHFGEFFADHTDLYTQGEKAFAQLQKDIDFRWFDSFFGQVGNLRFAISLSLLNGPANYASNIDWKDGTKTMNCILGCAPLNESSKISYDWFQVAPIVLHEFSHSYCNPLNDKYWDGMEKVAEAAFSKEAEFYTKGAYPNANYMMNESFVWASVLRYIESHPMEPDVNSWDEVIEFYLKDIVENRKFTLVPSMVEALALKEKGGYSDMDSFMPVFCSMLHE